MPYTFDAADHVSVGDPTMKSHYDQLLANGVAIARVMGRVVASGGQQTVWTDVTTYAMLPESYEFNLPAKDDCGGLTVRLAGYFRNEAGSQIGYVRLEYWDGIAWVSVASSEITFTTTSFAYTESVNLQANLNATETRYRFVSKVGTAGHRTRGMAWIAVKG